MSVAESAPAFPSPTDGYLEILGVGAAVDEATLTRRWQALTRLYHPDRYGAADPRVQADALLACALVNDAYRTLRDPFARAEYLLRRERSLRPDDLKARPPQDLFAEILEAQERIADADDDPEARAALPGLRARFQSAYDALRADLSTHFADYDAGRVDAALDGMAAVAGTRGYLRRALENVGAALARHPG